MPRFYCNQPLDIGMLLVLPDAVARHVQVLRLKEGELVTLFNGEGGEYTAINSTIQEFTPARYRGWVDLTINGTFWVGAALGALGVPP